VIVGVEAGVPRRMASWRLLDDRSRFEDEEIGSDLTSAG